MTETEPVTVPCRHDGPMVRPHRSDRLAGLDGLRGLAAFYVVLHHCWLLSFPGFPEINSPIWCGWMAFGHLAVAVFIVLSGFSLAVGPARSGWRLGGSARFFRRRAWRILPPYWAALLFSMVVAWTLVPQPGSAAPTAKSVLVYGLLMQDVFGAPTPNGALWSIAVEAQLYLLFPLLLLVRRRHDAVPLLLSVIAPVVLIGMLADVQPLVRELLRLSPQMAVLFTLGVVAAEGVSGDPSRAGRWPWLAAAAALPAVTLMVMLGLHWTVTGYLWVDLAAGPAVALLLLGVALGRPVSLVRLLDTGSIRRLGSFSYSLYLIHAPIVVALHHFLVVPNVPSGVPMLLVTLAVAVPVTLVASFLFASVFELPFQRHRSVGALSAAARARLSELPRPSAPGDPA